MIGKSWGDGKMMGFLPRFLDAVHPQQVPTNGLGHAGTCSAIPIFRKFQDEKCNKARLTVVQQGDDSTNSTQF